MCQRFLPCFLASSFHAMYQFVKLMYFFRPLLSCDRLLQFSRAAVLTERYSLSFSGSMGLTTERRRAHEFLMKFL